MKNKIITGLFLFSVALAGCKKDLELRPTDTVEEEVAYSSVASLQKGLNTAYANYGTGRLNTMFANSVTSDELKFGPQNGGFAQYGYRLQYTSSTNSNPEVTDMFYSYYNMIDQVNRVLSKIDQVNVDGDAGLTLQKAYIKGQLLALRGMGHFELLEGYAKKYDASDPNGVPVMLTPCLTCQPARNTVAEVIAQVEKDLTDAKTLMPTVVAATYNDLSLNQISVTAVQARVALYKREWQKAADFATTVINSGIKPLVTGTAFTGIWTDANTNETLFRSRYETSTVVGAQWNNAGIIFSPSDKINAVYPTGDIRKAAYIGTNSGGRYVKKFSGSARGTNVNDTKNIRTAEMYLIRAEAKAELNDLAGAASDINTLRAQRIIPYTNISYASKDLAIADVMLERYRELAEEGFRFYDLKRKGMDLQRAASDVDSPLWQTLAAGNFRFVYPIPSDEMLANRNIAQNEGY